MKKDDWFVIEMLEDVVDKGMTFAKGQRFIAWAFNKNYFALANLDMCYMHRDYCKKVSRLKIEYITID